MHCSLNACTVDDPKLKGQDLLPENEHMFTVNYVLINILGLFMGAVSDFWFVIRTRLHNEELNDLYSSPSIVRVIKSRRMRWAGHVALMGEERGVYRVLVGKLEGRRSLGRPKRRWVDNIRMDL